ncbi:MAG: hypothetical protein LQ343_002834 [Gyalolechia ehrenbergii]|nr:MAG: hypothetical protein LQ343_002834 [Gyalolechia ehrenbergii]
MARIAKRLIASYILDWIIIIGIVAVGAGLWNLTPNHRPFTLTDPSISYPYVEHEKVPTYTLFVVTVVAPLVLTFLVSILFPWPPILSTLKNPRSQARTWRKKLWSWHAAWLGLGLSFAVSFLLVQGMKNLFGKPRPDLLSRCDPDTENQARYALGGFPGVLNGFYLVSSTICRTQDENLLNDGFSSFPSGHATYAWAGMGYLALFFASKFGVTVPWMPYRRGESSSHSPTLGRNGARDDTRHTNGTSSRIPAPATATETEKPAAPPLPLFLLLLIPICTAIYISSTRFSDFRHHGFDIIFGGLMGAALSFFSFRLYHRPVVRGGGGSWGSRSNGRAFGFAGFGSGIGKEDRERKRNDDVEARDLEEGRMPNGGMQGVGPAASTAV